MKKIFSFTAVLLFSAALLHSCGEKQQAERPPQKVQVIQPVKLDLPIYKNFVGSIYGYKDIPIRARVEGFLESIHFQEGAYVKKGQLLYTIDSQPFEADVAEARSRVAEAKTQLVNAENELKRYKPLEHSKAVSQSDVDAAQATRDAAEANLEAAKANLRMAEINLSYATMYSPINGIIGKTAAQVGEYVGRNPNPVILNTVSRLDTVKVEFFLSENQYLQVMKSYQNRKLEYGTENMSERREKIRLKLSDGTMYKYTGHIDFIDRSISESTGAILVQASFPNPDKLLRPGLYAKVRLMFDYAKNSILIPQRCVVETQGQFSVMVVTDSNTVQSQQIEVGTKIDSTWQVTKGLTGNERLIYEGLQKVRSGMPVEATEVEFKIGEIK